MTLQDPPKRTRKDFQSDQEVRWCPGCGDYAILASVQKYMAEAGVDPAKTVVVSGIGCSSRFPYYMNTYGFHTIHGRAPAIATGLKVARPDLDVWLITGDGDSMSIGGNHLIHVLRRNVNITILMFNNEIYGLTKGQYSPTSPVGTVKKSTPMGSVDRPFNPLQLVLGSQATFVARSVDADPGHLGKILKAAHEHQGTSFVEILQNCVIFNKDFYKDAMERSVRPDKTVDLVAGEPVVYGKERDKGLRFHDMQVEACAPGDALVWNPSGPNSAPGFLMAGLSEQAGMPTPIGIFRDYQALRYDTEVNSQVQKAVAKSGQGNLKDLVYAGETWQV
ncbi:MAG: 2-oxoacid:ferredoxin oxidoreductase subunit beta [Planctomycetes bacterium]|nr:2-oxoacid:ferredoxin oxidoreductase subunit beta [Planctomycetota bacterium]MCB9911952.1 2-oxoacid:ferredoxin oxidoreductase subunit beta [Planctomycetota bacterium]HPF13917.1 2-oxoacid:ferredoxin oxidoreductase subunit beta [Planctomycetota bacterium]